MERIDKERLEERRKRTKRERSEKREGRSEKGSGWREGNEKGEAKREERGSGARRDLKGWISERWETSEEDRARWCQ